MSKFILLLLLGALIFPLASSGAVTKLHNFQGQFDSLGYFRPISILRSIEKQNKGIVNPSMSQESVRLLDSILITKKQDYSVGNLLTPTDLVVLDKLNKEISQLAFQSNIQRKSHGLELSHTIDSVMEANGERYALAIVAAGFSRSKVNYGRKEREYNTHRRMMLGADDGTKLPEKATSTIHALIFDAKDNTVAIYRKNHVAHREPLDKFILLFQVDNVLKDIFIDKELN